MWVGDYVRPYGSGDVESPDVGWRWVRIAEALPRKRFAMGTKSWRVRGHEAWMDAWIKLRNCAGWVSVDPSTSAREWARVRAFQVRGWSIGAAGIDADVGHLDRYCPKSRPGWVGGCAACGHACWDRRGGYVAFPVHGAPTRVKGWIKAGVVSEAVSVVGFRAACASSGLVGVGSWGRGAS